MHNYQYHGISLVMWASATRYEDEEAVDVCEAMERMAQLFLSDSGKVGDVTESDPAATDDHDVSIRT